MKTIQDVLEWLQKSEDEGIYEVGTQNVKRHLESVLNEQLRLHDVRLMLRKEYCNVCGQELTEIRGRYPKEPRRKVCACCAIEKLEWQDEQKNIGTCKSN